MEGMQLWIESNIIHCLVQKDFNTEKLGMATTQNLTNTIRVLSNGKYMPLLMDLSEMGNYRTLQLYHYFSPCSPVDICVKSRIFLVRSCPLNMLLDLFCLVNGNAFWNTIYHKMEEAINRCAQSAINNLK